MNMMQPILLLSAIMLAFAQHTHEDAGEYGHYSTWRKAVCEKNDQEMYKEMVKCFQLENKAVVDATSECAKKVNPESEGDTVAFTNAACQDLSLFKKFDDCFEEYEKDPDFLKKLQLSDEIEECYGRILEEYAMESLRNYFRDFSTESES